MGRSGRLAIVLVLFFLFAAGVVWSVKELLWQPPTVVLTPTNGAVNVNLQTVGSLGTGNHPTWVSYLVENAQNQWVHTTLWQVPAHTRVNVTIYQYDSGSPLRNQQLGLVTGTIGASASLACSADPTAAPCGTTFQVINSNDPNGNGVGHTFSIPTLKISVPLYGNSSTANLCAVAPCSATSTAYPHNMIKFSFMSPGPGNYPWQCFVPCGLGWLYGNGGPMSTVGYMGGFMKVA